MNKCNYFTMPNNNKPSPGKVKIRGGKEVAAELNDSSKKFVVGVQKALDNKRK